MCRWYHQVTTFGERSVAINIWFSRLWRFNNDDCASVEPSTPLKALEELGFASPNEAVR
jgi:hypothetical protein